MDLGNSSQSALVKSIQGLRTSRHARAGRDEEEFFGFPGSASTRQYVFLIIVMVQFFAVSRACSLSLDVILVLNGAERWGTIAAISNLGLFKRCYLSLSSPPPRPMSLIQ